MRRFVLLLLVCAVPATASAAVNPDLAHLQNSLKADMVRKFKTRAPGLKITTVTCTLPTSSGAKAHCKAYFTGGTVKGYYPVTATLHDLGGTLTWTASLAKCWNPTTKKYAAC
jgi:hypothetical protein